jgi:hypothetical protein
MILVDSSIWIRHLRQNDEALATLLEAGLVVTHPFVVGELAMGRLRDREDFLAAMHDLPGAITATDEEALGFVERHRLAGIGIGWIDAHVLAATALTPAAALWTGDRRLAAAARRLGLAAAASEIAATRRPLPRPGRFPG